MSKPPPRDPREGVALQVVRDPCPAERGAAGPETPAASRGYKEQRETWKGREGPGGEPRGRRAQRCARCPQPELAAAPRGPSGPGEDVGPGAAASESPGTNERDLETERTARQPSLQHRIVNSTLL